MRGVEAQVFLDRAAVLFPCLFGVVQQLGQESHRVELERLRLVEYDQLLLVDLTERSECRVELYPRFLVSPGHREHVAPLRQQPTSRQGVRALDGTLI